MSCSYLENVADRCRETGNSETILKYFGSQRVAECLVIYIKHFSLVSSSPTSLSLCEKRPQALKRGLWPLIRLRAGWKNHKGID